MSEMVDRVAAVLLPAFMGHGFDNPMSLARSHAHAVIEAMREPGCISVAGDEAYRKAVGGSHYGGLDSMVTAWRAMIDEALK